MIFLLCVFALVLGFSLVSRKYANPYLLTFVFGKKGAGKSLYMVREMQRDLKRGWTVYTDIQDIKLEGVRIFNTDDLGKFIPEPNSSIYIDEGGVKFDNRNFKTFPPELRDFFKYMRKYRCKCMINSQTYDIDLKIKACVDRLALSRAIGNVFSWYRPIMKTIKFTDANYTGESKIVDQLKWASPLNWKFIYMPKYHKFFDSFAAPARPFLDFTVFKSESPESALSELENAE